ncbi:hypothetical protein PMNALOAF_1209 [Methylobacterium adhaesivum]|jgi:nitrate/TMAO reductase-like tetraheme cytochrome c subunit|uniref:Uncharacterized protein n=1 Tax=Methylobacterium adhaesivum TaxID=333297 RepID=A0ABT8BEV1_9HYPH|nr:hypothetical protein [Methylobacterium adhaesivum]MDN3590644.1 hypothetical protein [Methylobacterium adhaesivum]GJD29967.1 hypothetical protein PMNALOAF_1209 [Methylobacterium adhaesivum]
MNNEVLILILAITTLGIVIGVALWQRARVASKKNDPERSAFTKDHGEAPRQNRPGTEH